MLKLDSSLQTNNSRIFDNAKTPAKQTQAKGSTLANPSNLNSETLVGDVGKLFDSNNLVADIENIDGFGNENEEPRMGERPKSWGKCVIESFGRISGQSQGADLAECYRDNESAAFAHVLGSLVAGTVKYFRQPKN